jgi:O-antigen/teichoic acid export membrane protein
MSQTKSIFINTISQILTKFITGFIGIAVRKLLAIYLGPAGLGEYLFVLTFVTVFGSIADFGTVLVTVRDAAKDKLHAPAIFGNVFWLRIVLSFLAMSCAVIIVRVLPENAVSENLRSLTIFGTVLILIFSTKASFSIIFQTLLRMEQWVIPEITASVLTLALTTIFIQRQKGLLELIGGLMLANIMAIIIAYFLSRRITKIDFHLQKKILSSLVINTIPMGGVLIVFSIYNKFDTVLLQSIKGPSTVGIYGIAYSIHDVLVLGAAYFMNVVLPILSEAISLNNKLGEQRTRQIFEKAFAVLFILGISMFIVIQITAPVIIAFIASPEFTRSILVLRILIFATLIAYFNHLTGYTLVALNKQKPFFFITVAALILNISTNLLLIPRLSEIGAALATIFTEALVFILTSALLFKTARLIPRPKAIPQIIRDLIKKRGEIFHE